MPFANKRLIRRVVIAGAALSSLASPTTASAQPSPTRFTIVDEGTAGRQDIVLIPGLTSSRAVWASEASRLKPNYRLHLVQVNGFGDQPAGVNATSSDLLPSVVDQLHGYITAKKMHPIVIGHSLGGLLALMLAKKYPQDVSKLVIVDALPFVGLMFGPQATVENVGPAAKAMHDGMLNQKPEQREAMEKRTSEMLALSADGRQRVVADGLASDPHVAAEANLEDFQTDIRADLASISTPTLVLYAFDPTLIFPNGMRPTQAMADTITSSAYRTMPNVKLARVDNSRHFIMFDQPEVFAKQIEAFIR